MQVRRRPAGAPRAALFTLALLVTTSAVAVAQPATLAPERAEGVDVVVAQDGTGDVTTIQAALDALPDGGDGNRTILIRRGTYREKIFVTKNRVSLVGEDREGTRIEFAELRRNWKLGNPDDWGSAVVNVGDGVSDLVIANLTIRNDYGRLHGDHDHQFAIRGGGAATRIALLHATVIADGGDTVSLWNSTSGLTYYADCWFEGWEDFFCPRGTAFVTNTHFFAHDMRAAIWHDGSKSRDDKLVIRASTFDGVPYFPLGRNHRDGQFYLLDARFTRNMADRPIYLANPVSSYKWGARHYYSSAHREGGDFAWFADNLQSAEGSPAPEDITAAWTFRGRWDPERTLPTVLPFAAIPRPYHTARRVPVNARLEWLGARNATGYAVAFGATEATARVTHQKGTSFDPGPLRPGTTYRWRVDAKTAAGTVRGTEWTFTTAGPEDDRPSPSTLAPARPPSAPIRIVLAGDSTVTDDVGWGAGLRAHLAPRVTVVNLAQKGRSSKSFIDEGHWAKVMAEKADYVLIQFGHNDQPGKGPARETDPATTYRDYLARMIDDVWASGATPVIVTSLTRRGGFGDDGHLHSDLVSYVEAAKVVATARGAPIVDLHARSVEVVDRMGATESLTLGPSNADGTPDKTHLNAKGSALFGGIVAEELARVVPALAADIR